MLYRKEDGRKMNPMALLQLKGLFDQFKNNHPKVPMFFNAVSQNIGEGSIIEINVTSAEGKKFCTNMKVTQSDIEMIEELKKLAK